MQHRLDVGDDARAGEFAALDAHLAQCAKCSTVWLELLRSRELLASVRSDAPTPEEIESMWQAIDAAVPAQLPAIPMPSRGVLFRFLGASAAVAACLFIAFILGEERYGDVTAGAYSSPSTADARAFYQSVDSGRFAQADSVSFGYQVHDGPFPTDGRESIDSRTAVAVGKSPYSGESWLDRYYSDDPTRALRRRGFTDESKRGAALLPEQERFGDGDYEVARGETPEIRLGALFVAGQPLQRSYEADRAERMQGAQEEQLAESLGRELEAAGTEVVVGKPVQSVSETSAPTPRPTMQIITGNPIHELPGRVYKLDMDPPGVASGTPNYTLDSSPADEGLTPVAQVGEVAELTQPARAQGATRAAAARPTSTKIIKTGEITTEVDDYAQAVQQASEVLTRFECFIADAATREAAGGALVGELVIRVAPPHFEALYDALRRIGRVESEQIKAADVTAEYVDVEARIAALKITEARLVELIKSKSFIDRIEDLLKVEQEMNRVRTLIEQLEGKLRVMADRIALSTITLRLREPARIVPTAKLSVEISSLDDAAAALNTALAELDSRMLSGKVSKRDTGALVGEYRLHVMLDRFGAALAAVSALGRVDARDVTDWREQSAATKWANRVPCKISVTLFERARELPSGNLDVQVTRLDETIPQIAEVLDAVGASIASNRTTKRDDGSSVANLTLRVPAGEFAVLAERLANIGRVTAKQLSGEAGAIHGGAAKTPCTLALSLSEPVRQIPSGGMVIEIEKFADARDRLSDLVTKRNIQVLASNSSQRTDGTWVGRFQLGISAREIDDAVADLDQLGKVSSREIRGIGLGELSRIDPQALGVIEVILAEKAALTPEPDRAGDSFRRYLRDGLAGLYDSLGMIVFGLILMAPWLVIATLVGWLIARLWRRRSAQRAPAKSA